MIYRWKISIWEYIQHYSLLGKCKLKPQWGITIHIPEWLKLKQVITPDAGQEAEKLDHICTADGNVHGTATLDSNLLNH